jgi:nitrite reductase (NADH) large subunit
MAAAGCPRNCSESYVRDVGVVAVGGGKWEIYVGGAAGGSVRKGDLLCVVETHEEVLKMAGRFLQYYREHAKYMERTYDFVARIGIDILRGILVEDSLGLCIQLDEKMQEAVEAYRDPWREAHRPAYTSQFVPTPSLRGTFGLVGTPTCSAEPSVGCEATVGSA